MVVTVIVRIICAVLGKICADEFKSWTPRWVEWLIRVAAARVPEAYRERCAEEWRSHANEVPGEVGKLVHAIGAVGAAYKMRWLETKSKPKATEARGVQAKEFELSVMKQLKVIRAELVRFQSDPQLELFKDASKNIGIELTICSANRPQKSQGEK